MEREEAYMGFNDFGLLEGEEIRIVKGVRLYVAPVRCEVVKEYPKFICIRKGFRRKSSDREKGLWYEPDCINKASLLCGDVIICRASDGKILLGTSAGTVGYVNNPEVR